MLVPGWWNENNMINPSRSIITRPDYWLLITSMVCDWSGIWLIVPYNHRMVFESGGWVILRPLLSKAQGCKDFWKPSKPCHVGIHWIALTEYSQMSTHAWVSVIFLVCFLHYFVLFEWATSSILGLTMKQGGIPPNPWAAEADFVHGTNLQKHLKSIWTLSCWY